MNMMSIPEIGYTREAPHTIASIKFEITQLQAIMENYEARLARVEDFINAPRIQTLRYPEE
jgi:hypothetical protein